MFIGPGESDVTWDHLSIDPLRYQVFDVTDGIPKLIEYAWHRLEAMQAAKDLVGQGRCPAVVSFYLQPSSEWTEVVQVARMEEASEVAQ